MISCFTKKLHMMREQVYSRDEPTNHQLLIAVAVFFILHLCTRCNIPESLLNHMNSFHRGMFKLDAKFHANLLLYSLSHSECNNHSHILSQGRLPPPLTSIVKSSLFTHTDFSPFSLAVRFHQCLANCSHYINNGWTFSR